MHHEHFSAIFGINYTKKYKVLKLDKKVVISVVSHLMQ